MVLFFNFNVTSWWLFEMGREHTIKYLFFDQKLVLTISILNWNWKYSIAFIWTRWDFLHLRRNEFPAIFVSNVSVNIKFQSHTQFISFITICFECMPGIRSNVQPAVRRSSGQKYKKVRLTQKVTLKTPQCPKRSHHPKRKEKETHHSQRVLLDVSIVSIVWVNFFSLFVDVLVVVDWRALLKSFFLWCTKIRGI